MKNFVYSFSVQAISLILSLVTGFVLPKLMKIDDFGYWQMYQLYISYIMVFIFGYNDGMYLKYGNLSIDQLKTTNIKASLNIMGVISCIVTFMMFSILFLTSDNINIEKNVVIIFVILNLIIMNYYGTFLTILQFTNEIVKYAKIVMFTKIIFTILLILNIVSGFVDYKVIIFSEFFSKIIVLTYLSIYFFKKLKTDQTNWSTGFLEYKDMIKIGYKILLSNIIGLLLIGIGRIYIERTMPIEYFANYSFGITIVSFVLLFITASSIPIYPLLRRHNVKSHIVGFSILKWSTIMIYCIFCISILFLDDLINVFLPIYSKVALYLPFLYGMVYFESKSLILYLNYFKIIRKESVIFYINLISLSIITISIVFIEYIGFNNNLKINIVLFSTLITLYIKSMLSEIYLNKYLNNSHRKYSFVLLELVVVISLFYVYINGFTFIFIFILTSLSILSLYNIKLYIKKLN